MIKNLRVTHVELCLRPDLISPLENLPYYANIILAEWYLLRYDSGFGLSAPYPVNGLSFLRDCRTNCRSIQYIYDMDQQKFLQHFKTKSHPTRPAVFSPGFRDLLEDLQLLELLNDTPLTLTEFITRFAETRIAPRIFVGEINHDL